METFLTIYAVRLKYRRHKVNAIDGREGLPLLAGRHIRLGGGPAAGERSTARFGLTTDRKLY